MASYVSRPSSIDQFCRTCEVLQKGYGAICLMENADQMYEQYLNRKSGMPASFFLFAGEAIANKYVKAGSRQNSKLGLYPTPVTRTCYSRVSWITVGRISLSDMMIVLVLI